MERERERDLSFSSPCILRRYSLVSASRFLPSDGFSLLRDVYLLRSSTTARNMRRRTSSSRNVASSRSHVSRSNIFFPSSLSYRVPASSQRTSSSIPLFLVIIIRLSQPGQANEGTFTFMIVQRRRRKGPSKHVLKIVDEEKRKKEVHS